MTRKAVGLSGVLSLIVALTNLGGLAHASPALTFPAGTKVATGTRHKLTIKFFKHTDSAGNILGECSGGALESELVKNSGTAMELDITSAGFTGTATEGKCTSTFGSIAVTTAVANGLPWCLRATNAMEADEYQVRGGKCSEAARKIRFILDSNTVGECTYSRTSALAGTFTTSPAVAELTISKQEFTREGGSILCPASMKLDWVIIQMDVFLESSGAYIS